MSQSQRVPDDVIVFDILTRVAVKSLIRFRCISKSWNSAITSPIFITKHLNLNQAKSLTNNINDDHNGFLLYTLSTWDLWSHKELRVSAVCNRDHTLMEIFSCEIPFFCAKTMVGFCNGLYCFYHYQKYIIYLWNPSIEKFKILIATPFIPICSFGVALGFANCSANIDFKVLRIMFQNSLPDKQASPPEAEVYTLSTDSWRSVSISGDSFGGSRPNGSVRALREKPFFLQDKPFIFFNGALHSIAYAKGRNFILCFDINDEIFREIMLPEKYLDGLSPNINNLQHLVVFKGLLALVAFGKDLDEERNLCFIWMMREYGVVESWTKRTIPVGFVKFESVVGCTSNGELLIETDDSWVVSFDPDSLKVNNLGLKSHKCLGYTSEFMESFVLLGR